MGKAAARAKFDSSIMNLKSIRRKTMYRKTILTTIMLLVAAIALSAAAFANTQECCKAKQECCKSKQDCCKSQPECCKSKQDCCKSKQECCSAMKQPGAAPGSATQPHDTQTATVKAIKRS